MSWFGGVNEVFTCITDMHFYIICCVLRKEIIMPINSWTREVGLCISYTCTQMYRTSGFDTSKRPGHTCAPRVHSNPSLTPPPPPNFLDVYIFCVQVLSVDSVGVEPWINVQCNTWDGINANS